MTNPDATREILVTFSNGETISIDVNLDLYAYNPREIDTLLGDKGMFIELNLIQVLENWLIDFKSKEIQGNNGQVYMTNQIVKVGLKD